MRLLKDELAEALIEIDREGAWASNYREQGTSMGLEGGLLGIDMEDERIRHTDQLLNEAGIRVQYKVISFKTDHENTLKIFLQGKSGRQLQIIAVSTGGGMFEIREMDGCKILIRGDAYHLVVPTDRKFPEKDLRTLQEGLPEAAQISWSTSGSGGLLLISSSLPLSESVCNPLSETFHNLLIKNTGASEILSVAPVLPVLSGREREFPFNDLKGLLSFAGETGYSLGRIGLIYESCRSGLSEKELLRMMKGIAKTIDQGILKGLAGTENPDRILPPQSHLVGKAQAEKRTGTDPLVNNLIANITALMEAKSAMQVIVAAPTAGSCGTLGGTIRAFCDTQNLEEQDKIMAYFAGGLVGVLFAMGPGFSAEEHGCQVETGAAATMTAAALVELSGGSASQALGAASMALQNTLGLICDPVADRVEVPCLGRNVTAGMNALGASTMALSGFEEVIPLDQVLDAVFEVGRSMPAPFRCSGRGGLSVVQASLQITNNLQI
jgi:L-serine dehydratase